MQKTTICGGCAAKLPQGMLKDVLHRIPPRQDENVIVGYQTSDDAGVYRVADDLAMIQTIDFFPPMVADPYRFGKIAAANALSDVAAMGGTVKTALNVVAYPDAESPDMLAEILRGGAEKVHEAGGVIIGGHSIRDAVLKYGLAVMGAVHPDQIWRNNTCKIGDVLVLTKLLGTGMIVSAHPAGQVSDDTFSEALGWMETINQPAASIAKHHRIHAATDVTGFGFLGHLNEMITPDYSARVFANEIPYLPEVQRLATDGLVTSGGLKNQEFLGNSTLFHNTPGWMQHALCDPQTSGGLLFSAHPDDVAALVRALHDAGIFAKIVGEIVPREAAAIIVQS